MPASNAPSPTPGGQHKSADAAYYRSGSVSAINNSTAITRKGRPGTPLKVDRTPHQDPNDTSTDRYYRSGGSKASQRFQPKGKITVPLNPRKRTKSGKLVELTNAGKIAGTVTQEPGLGRVAVPIRVRSKGDVIQAKDAVFEAIASGAPKVFVEYADTDCLRRIRAAVDLGVARGQITDDRVRDVKYIPIAKDGKELATRMFGEIQVPDAVETVAGGQIGNAAEIDDLAAFVKGDTDHEDDNVTSPTVQQGSVGVAVGGLGDPVIAAARGETTAGADERPEGKASADGVQRVAVRAPSRGKRKDPRKPDVDPVVAAAAAEPVDDPVAAAAAAESAADPVIAAAVEEKPESGTEPKEDVDE